MIRMFSFTRRRLSRDISSARLHRGRGDNRPPARRYARSYLELCSGSRCSAVSRRCPPRHPATNGGTDRGRLLTDSSDIAAPSRRELFVGCGCTTGYRMRPRGCQAGMHAGLPPDNAHPGLLARSGAPAIRQPATLSVGSRPRCTTAAAVETGFGTKMNDAAAG